MAPKESQHWCVLFCLLRFLIMAYASIAPGINNKIEPLIPALQSNLADLPCSDLFLWGMPRSPRPLH